MKEGDGIYIKVGGMIKSIDIEEYTNCTRPLKKLKM
jgi:hypothetical protein